MQYAGFLSRFAASFLDGLILSVVSLILNFAFGFAVGISGADSGMGSILNLINSLLQLIISFGYYIYFIGSKGQTPGKMALKIKVVNPATNLPPGYVSAFLREVIGKLISSVVIGLGYLWMLWDPKKQTWHDKIAKTIVIKSP